MSRIWKESKQKGSALLLMLAMADFADDDGGNIFPSLKTLADKTRLSTRQVTRLIQSLEKSGDLEVGRSKNQSNRYNILFVGGDNLSSPTSGTDKMSSARAKQDKMSRSTRHGSPVVLDIAMADDSSLSTNETSRGAPAPEPLTAEQYKKRIAKALASGIAMHNGFTGAIEFEFHKDFDWNTKTARAFVEHMAVKYQPTAEGVHRFAQWWRQNAWQGQKGQAPSLKDIRENWPQAFTSDDGFIPVEVYE